MISPDDASTQDPLDARLRRLDESAFEEFVGLTRAHLWRLALGMMGSHAHAEDVLQECYIRAHDCLLDGRWDGKQPHAWMRTVLTREALRHLKRRKRWHMVATYLRQAHPPPVQDHKSQELPAQLRAHLDVLPPLQRIALLLVALDGASTQEVASALGKSQGAIEQLLVRARRTLRQRLDHVP